MKKIKNFISRHKILSWVIGIILTIMLLDAIISNDFKNLLNVIYSLFMLCIYLFILYLMTSKKSYQCPNCGKRIKKDDTLCNQCGVKIDGKNNKLVSKRVFLKSKLFYMIGEAFIFIPIGMGFLYLIFAPIVFATNGGSMSPSNTLFIFYTKSNLLPFTIICTLIGIVFVLIGFYFKKKERIL